MLNWEQVFILVHACRKFQRMFEEQVTLAVDRKELSNAIKYGKKALEWSDLADRISNNFIESAR